MRRTITVQLALMGSEFFVDTMTDNLMTLLETWEHAGDVTQVINVEMEDDDDDDAS